MGVDTYQTYQTSCTTFSASLSAAPVMILARDMALSLGQVSTKYTSIGVGTGGGAEGAAAPPTLRVGGNAPQL